MHRLGTLCVIDDKPRSFSDEEVRLLRDLGELAQQELVALQLATTDDLTGISNRRGFEALARHALSVCRRMAQPATLLFFDLDRFKQINDVYGHATGDRALITFAHGLLAVFRESDVVGRLGGDEFAVLLTGAAALGAAVGIDRLQSWIDDHANPEQTGYGGIHFSAGHIACDACEPQSIEILLRRADQAMYQDKRSLA
jgi:diguanylate cyclase (GGDEF)-like protein